MYLEGDVVSMDFEGSSVIVVHGGSLFVYRRVFLYYVVEEETMGSILLEIQETVRKYAGIISQVAQVDVEVVDEHLFRVAGTGMFAEHVNENMSWEGYVYRKVLQTGQSQVIYEPGKELICQNCPNCGCCGEEIEISMPIRMNEEIVGVIGLVGVTPGQKERILRDETLYMGLVEQIGDFIAAKAREAEEMRNKDILLDILDYTVSRVDQGILLLGSDGAITTANEAAKKQLEISSLEGKQVAVASTGDQINGQTEYRLEMDGRLYYVMGTVYNLAKTSQKYGRMVVFQNIKEVKKKYYEITSTVCSGAATPIIGSSRQMEQLREEIRRISQSSSTVLITGESGTGKEMVATTIWKAGNRKEGRFVAVNCAAIPEALLESELFGYVKGAFTGADPSGRIGKFELANKGIIFLDEIGDMPLYLQAKLLRVLQERKIVRIGSNRVIPIDVRVIAATNKDLKEMMREKKFREDLYYRLNVIPLHVAPLRERPGDIQELAILFAERYAKLLGKQLWKITGNAMEILKGYKWEGNVRELENVMEFMVNMMGEEGILDESMLPREFCAQEISLQESVQQEREEVLSLEELERREIRKALRIYGNTTAGKKSAAEKLGIGLATLYRKMENLY